MHILASDRKRVICTENDGMFHLVSYPSQHRYEIVYDPEASNPDSRFVTVYKGSEPDCLARWSYLLKSLQVVNLHALDLPSLGA